MKKAKAKKAKAKMFRVTEEEIAILRYLESTADPYDLVMDTLLDNNYLQESVNTDRDEENFVKTGETRRLFKLVKTDGEEIPSELHS
jgi:hypothetical protein